MGVVYRARQVALDRAVALKAIRPEMSATAEYRKRFRREARLAAAIEHPNIVPVYEAGETDGVLYLVMRWVPGTDLRALLEAQGPLAPGRAVALLAPVADALGAAHRRGLVHRDVKPANVLISHEHGRERSWLTDFGIARTEADTGGAMTRTGAMVGTPDYLAPERIEGRRGDAASDVYAYGCVLYEALTAQAPFRRNTELAVMHAHLNAEPPAARDVEAAVPAALDGVVARAMAKDPAARFPSAEAAAEATRAALEDAGGPAGARPTAPASRPTAAEEPSPATAGAGPSTPAETAAPAVAAAPPTREAPGPTAPVATPPPGPPARRGPPPAPARRRRGAAALAAVAALAAIAALVAVLSGGGDGGPGATVGAGTRTPAATGSAGRVGAPIPVPGGPDGIATGAGSVWVAASAAGTLVRLDARRRRVTGRFAVGRDPDSVAVAGGVAWVSLTGENAVRRVSVGGSGTLGGPAPVGRAPEGLAVEGGTVWVANRGDGTASRLDAGTAAARGAPVKVGRAPVGVTAFAGAIWVANSGDGTITRIDPRAGRATATVDVGGEPRAVAGAAGRLWVVDARNGAVRPVDPAGNRVGARIAVGADPRALAAEGSTLWVPSAVAGTLARVDARTARRAGEPVKLPAVPLGVAVGDGVVWSTSLAANAVVPYAPPG